MTQHNLDKAVSVSVTWGDIQSGVREDCISCPVALAASRAFGRECLVENYRIIIAEGKFDDQPRLVWGISERVRLRIKRFDRSGLMAPFNFSVRAESSPA